MAVEIAERAVTGTTTADQVHFSMRGLPLLSRGATMGTLGIAGNLWAHSKVYSTGGENGLHSHDLEDHCFIVLQGEAKFQFGDGSSFVARSNEGVVLPKGTKYRFQTNGVDNLVMIRVGGAQLTAPDDIHPQYKVPREIATNRVGKDGQHAAGDAKDNGAHSEPTEYLPGKFFSPD